MDETRERLVDNLIRKMTPRTRPRVIQLRQWKSNHKGAYEKEFKINRLIRLEIDNYKCTECGNDKSLHVHHIIYRNDGGTNDIDNMITLCHLCHKEKHKGEHIYDMMI